MFRPIRSSLAALLLAGCAFGFQGGSLPPEIRTVAVLPFENETSDPTLGQEVTLAVRQAMERRLGLRGASEAQADAVVRGRVLRYEPDQPTSVTTSGNRVQVNQRQLIIGVEVSMTTKKDGVVILRLTESPVGSYDTGREAEGRRKALEVLVNNIVQGAQSKW